MTAGQCVRCSAQAVPRECTSFKILSGDHLGEADGLAARQARGENHGGHPKAQCALNRLDERGTPCEGTRANRPFDNMKDRELGASTRQGRRQYRAAQHFTSFRLTVSHWFSLCIYYSVNQRRATRAPLAPPSRRRR